MSTSSLTLDTSAPERSHQQRMDALQRANGIRTQRSQLKINIRSGEKSVLPLLQDPPVYIETMKVKELLLAVPKLGEVKVNRILTTCRISPVKSVGGLSDRQRRDLLAMLRGR